MDDDDVGVILWTVVLVLLALTVIVFAGWAFTAHAKSVVIVNESGEVLRGQFLGAEIGEPVTVLVDTTAVFRDGFEP